MDLVPNHLNPSYESMFTIYLGAHNIDPIVDIQQEQDYEYDLIEKEYSTHAIETIIVVNFLFIKYLTFKEIQVFSVIKHEDYDFNTNRNDIALLQLKTPAELNKNIQLACLPDMSRSSSYPPPSITTAVALGWGKTNVNLENLANKLRSVNLPIVNSADCRRLYRQFSGERQICAGNGKRDTCQGDSGTGKEYRPFFFSNIFLKLFPFIY
jgi:secreted trypsin-like serine protease